MTPTWLELARRAAALAFVWWRHSPGRKWWRRHVTTRGLQRRLARQELDRLGVASAGSPIQIGPRIRVGGTLGSVGAAVRGSVGSVVAPGLLAGLEARGGIGVVRTYPSPSDPDYQRRMAQMREFGVLPVDRSLLD